jgi:hypothetical protein
MLYEILKETVMTRGLPARYHLELRTRENGTIVRKHFSFETVTVPAPLWTTYIHMTYTKPVTIFKNNRVWYRYLYVHIYSTLVGGAATST